LLFERDLWLLQLTIQFSSFSMTLRQSVRLLLVVFSCLLSSMASAQTPGRIVTKTRLQVLFADLETRWLKAVQAKDKPELDKLLSDSFEVWSPTQAGPIPLEDWRQAAVAHPPKAFEIRQIAVRAVSEDVSAVSFVLEQTFAGKAARDNEFVVDIWKKDSERWRCTDRYVSQVLQASPAVEDVRPDGKQ
jgi:hypothetical protein